MAKRPSIPTLASDILDLRARLIQREQRIEAEAYTLLQSMLDEWENELKRLLGGTYRGPLDKAILGRRAAILAGLRRITTQTLRAVLGALQTETAGIYRDNLFRVASTLAGARAVSLTPVGLSFSTVDVPAVRAALASKIPGLSELRSLAGVPARVENLMRKDLARAIADGYRVDQLVTDWKNRIGAGAVVPEVRALARTAVMSASNTAHLDVYQKNKELVPKVRWEATFDRRTCVRCGSLHGREFPVNDAPPIPAHLNCVLPWVRVQSGSVIAAAKSLYRGRVVQVRTKSGSIFAVTEKHPVLTIRGWVRAADVHVGDQLVNSAPGKRSSPSVGPDHNDAPRPIHEVFRSLEESVGVGSMSVPASPEDLHGDGVGVDGEVHVVWAHGRVPTELDLASSQHHGELALNIAPPFKGPGSLSGLGGLDERLRSLRLSAYRIVGGLSEAESLFGRGVRHAGEHGRGSVPRCDACGYQATANDATVNPKGIRDRLLALPGFVSADDVVDVQFDEYAGHVFDLQTASGVIVCEGGPIIHNCRCVLLPVFADRGLNAAVHGVGAYQSPTGGTYFRNKDRDFEKFLRSRTPDFRADFFPSALKRKVFEGGRLSLAEMVSRDGSIKTDEEILRMLRRRP